MGRTLFLYVERTRAGWMIPCLVLLCPCACVLCSPRKLKRFLNESSGVLLRVEGTFGLVVIDFCEVSQVNLEIFTYQIPCQCRGIELRVDSLSVLSFNCDIFMKVVWFFSSIVKLLVLCINVLKSVRGVQMLCGF